MEIRLAHNHYDENHLAEVVAEMRIAGTPTIKVTVVDDDTYQAIEGCHRLRACEILGVVPEIMVIDDSVSIEDAEIDYDGCATRVGDIGDPGNYSIEF